MVKQFRLSEQSRIQVLRTEGCFLKQTALGFRSARWQRVSFYGLGFDSGESCIRNSFTAGVLVKLLADFASLAHNAVKRASVTQLHVAASSTADTEELIRAKAKLAQVGIALTPRKPAADC